MYHCAVDAVCAQLFFVLPLVHDIANNSAHYSVLLDTWADGRLAHDGGSCVESAPMVGDGSAHSHDPVQATKPGIFQAD